MKGLLLKKQIFKRFFAQMSHLYQKGISTSYRRIWGDLGGNLSDFSLEENLRGKL